MGNNLHPQLRIVPRSLHITKERLGNVIMHDVKALSFFSESLLEPILQDSIIPYSAQSDADISNRILLSFHLSCLFVAECTTRRQDKQRISWENCLSSFLRRTCLLLPPPTRCRTIA